MHAAGSSHPCWRHVLPARARAEESRHISELIREARALELLLRG